MSALCCPHCGRALFVIGEEGEGRREEAAPRHEERRAEPPADEGGLPATSFRENKWRIDCPEHGWHGAKFWPAKDGKPAVVKCTGQNDAGEFCATKVPAGVAKQRAGMP